MGEEGEKKMKRERRRGSRVTVGVREDKSRRKWQRVSGAAVQYHAVQVQVKRSPKQGPYVYIVSQIREAGCDDFSASIVTCWPVDGWIRLR